MVYFSSNFKSKTWRIKKLLAMLPATEGTLSFFSANAPSAGHFLATVVGFFATCQVGVDVEFSFGLRSVDCEYCLVYLLACDDVFVLCLQPTNHSEAIVGQHELSINDDAKSRIDPAIRVGRRDHRAEWCFCTEDLFVAMCTLKTLEGGLPVDVVGEGSSLVESIKLFLSDESPMFENWQESVPGSCPSQVIDPLFSPVGEEYAEEV